jgi:hypothetical protein
MRKHRNDEIPGIKNSPKSILDDPKSILDDPKNILDDPKSILDDPKSILDDPKNILVEHTECDNNICIKCQKPLSTKSSLQKHIKTCKGVSKPLECYLCHKVFSTSGNKSRHLKICKGSIDISTIPSIIDQSQTAEVINNNINNSTNTTNNTTNNNNITNNIHNTIVMYNDQNIEFKDDHITKKDLKRIFNGASVQSIQAISQYALKLLENIDNLCVRKKHLTNSYCEVHEGNGVWTPRPDNSVFERFSQDVAISANDKLYENPSIGTNKVRNEITELVSDPEDVHSQSIKLRRELRSIVLHKTKGLDNTQDEKHDKDEQNEKFE